MCLKPSARHPLPLPCPLSSPFLSIHGAGVSLDWCLAFACRYASSDGVYYAM